MVDWFSSLSPSHADAFSQDSSLVTEARACLFHHSPLGIGLTATWTTSLRFSGSLVQGGGLLGESIHKLQWSWDGPEELKHGNYILLVPTQGVKVLKGGVCQGIPKKSWV